LKAVFSHLIDAVGVHTELAKMRLAEIEAIFANPDAQGSPSSEDKVSSLRTARHGELRPVRKA
jgi:hypothetical protein